MVLGLPAHHDFALRTLTVLFDADFHILVGIRTAQPFFPIIGR